MGIVLISLSSSCAIQLISHEIGENIAQNVRILEQSEHTETLAETISDNLIPAFVFLHSLDVEVTRHVYEFELYILDFDRSASFLVISLDALQSNFTNLPEVSKYFSTSDRNELKEIVDVFIDITNEALENRSPNKLLQLLEDSEDILSEFREQLDKRRSKLNIAVQGLGGSIKQDLYDARQNLSLQKNMLQELNRLIVYGLILLVAFIILTTTVLFRSLHRRLNAVAKYAHSISNGKYLSTIDFVSSDKLGEMATSVSQMGNSMAAMIGELEDKANKAKRAARTAKRLAYYDTLTGLPNRYNFLEASESAIVEAIRLEENVAFAYMDLDGFKKVNDSFGHDIGDKLLCSVADRLTHCLREDDAIARSVSDTPVVVPSRLGGDEFTFLIKRLHDQREAKKIAWRIHDALIKPFLVGDQKLFITPSIGVAVFPRDGVTVNELLKNADIAMYQAKEKGRNTVKLFTSEIGKSQEERITMERDLAHALEREEMGIHYQAKVDLNSGRIVGAEALLRWDRPQYGMVSPLDFIPLAEETGVIIQIGNWVLREVCGQIISWKSQDIDPVPIAVNVSAKQFTDANLTSMVRDCIGMSDICVGNIEIELTESILMADTDLAVNTLTELKKMDVRTSMDDFGTGYSSLSYLKRFPLGALKIDRSFVRDIKTDVEDAAIVKAILAMSQSLGLKVIAEGVENEYQVKYLRKHGCQEAQGYFFSKPIPSQEFTNLLRRGNITIASVA